jgi:glutathione S-transferase
MADDLIFYTHPMSRGRIARWALEEVGRPYRTEIVAYGPAMKAPEYRAVNPMGKVPALRHGDVVITEVAAICAYLADAFPDARLAPPAGDRLRGPLYRWMFFAAGPLEAATLNRSFQFVVPKEQEGRVGYGNFEAVMATLEGALEADDYLVGGHFSVADILIGSALGWGMFGGSIEKRPAFVAYCDRLFARPARARAVAIDSALVEEQKRAAGA